MKEKKHTIVFENKDVLENVFIPTGKEWESTESESLSIVESGKEGVLFNKIITGINKAKKMICLQSFLIQDTKIIDALLEAKERGVEIFVMDAAVARLKKEAFEEEEGFATKDYKNMLNQKFNNNFVHRQAEYLHAKFILIDPKTTPKGYLFTGNFNQKPFFENPEIAVVLDVDQIIELYEVFVYHFWEHTKDEQAINGSFEKVKPLGKFKTPNLSAVLITSPNKELSNLKNTLLKAVEMAKGEIVFSTFGFDVTHEVSQSILTKLKEGVKVTVFCRLREKAIIGNIDELRKNGAIVICHPLIHAKFLLVDGKEGYVFTANFEKGGMDTSFEVGVKLYTNQVVDLKNVISVWKNSFPYVYEVSKPIKEINEYKDCKDTRNYKKVKEKELEFKNRGINNTKEFLEFVKQKSPKIIKAKKHVIELTIKFEQKGDYNKIKGVLAGVSLIEYEKPSQAKKKNKKQLETKKQTEKALLLDVEKVTINEELINLFNNEYSSYKIFA